MDAPGRGSSASPRSREPALAGAVPATAGNVRRRSRRLAGGRRWRPELCRIGLVQRGASFKRACRTSGTGWGTALTSIAVCVPVRNEVVRLPALLNALSRQHGAAGPFIACLLFDNCDDGSEDLARARAAALPFALRCETLAGGTHPNAGRARAAAMAAGAAALGTAGGLLLTTDADGIPADRWVAQSCAALERADVVAGRILRQPHPPSPMQDRIEAYYDRLFALRRWLDPVPWEATATHHCTGGANLGFRSAAYAQLGGFLPLRSGEDGRIVDDAMRLGLRVRRDGASVVHTSARRTGRVPGGLAEGLRHLDDPHRPVQIAHPADAAWQYRRHAEARAAFTGGRPADVAAALGLTAHHATGVARDCPNAEAFAMRIVPAAPGGEREVTLDHAEAILASLEAELLDIVA